MSKQINFKITTDSHYSVSIKLASGRSINEDLGYVTHGMDFDDVLRIRENNIALDRK